MPTNSAGSTLDTTAESDDNILRIPFDAYCDAIDTLTAMMHVPFPLTERLNHMPSNS
jgi:hypothetical protein